MDKYVCVVVRSDIQNNNKDIECLMKNMMKDDNGTLPADWDRADAVKMLDDIIHISTFPKDFTVYIEMGYVDKVYRDIYYHHYSARHFNQSRNCKRLFFFDGVKDDSTELSEDAEQRFIGVSVIQPNGIIGRSYWSPKYFLELGYYVRTTKFAVTLLGRHLHINAFPYTMQDREATTCAEVTVLNLAAYYSQSYSEYRYTLLSDIESVEAQHSAERIFPSQGMNYADVARSLAHIGLSPRIYSSRIPTMTQNNMRRYLYYYVESGIPFGVAVESSEPGMLHSMVCVGHGRRNESWPADCAVNYLVKEPSSSGSMEFRNCWIVNSADAYESFVVMDDSARPYETVHFEVASKNWTFPQKREDGLTRYAVEYLCVPLYKRVFLEVDGAAEVFATFIVGRMGFQAVMERMRIADWSDCGKEKDKPLIVRIFLASSRTFLTQRMQALNQMEPGQMDDACLEVYQNLFCPRFVWVCELYTKESFVEKEPKAIGEIVVDATARRIGSMGGLDSIILTHYPHYITYRNPDSSLVKLEKNEKKLDTWSPFPQFHGNLRDFNA